MNPATPLPATLIGDVCRDVGPALILLTGTRSAGKTRWCGELVRTARAARLHVAGLLSPPVFEGGRKTAIDLVDLTTGERRRLAERPSPGLTGMAGLGWRFDLAVLAWANARLARLAACDLLVIDELGPLEFRGEGGFAAAFTQLDARRYRLAVAVVRPELLHAAQIRWPWCSGIFATKDRT
ncbi:MAG TPA: nucleoside-triphosphatase [Thiobacillaceae bacterium]|nr:nucleoside-triphosphatase [Thiobacillaceae bacterium]HNU65434.1 nucleoside-triphosphatase [Thiobacillaceae bacterium]